jgi:predicted negative regulator of RcsB-dependent stress response
MRVAQAAAVLPPVAAAPSKATTAHVPVNAEPMEEPPTTEGGAEKLLDSARRTLAAGNGAGAEALSRQVLAADPNEHHAMEVLARALLAQGRAAEALPYIETIVKKRAKRAAYRMLEGDAKGLLGDHAGAMLAWRAAKALDPATPGLAARLGMTP